MTARKILGLFDSEAAVSAAVEALNRAGFRDHTVSRGADDASGLAGAASRPLDEGRVTVAPRRGRVLLTVRGEDAEIGRIEEILKQQGALDAVAGQAAPEAAPREPTTLSGAPADHGASAGVLPETPMPTGSGVMGSRGEWLVEREASSPRTSIPRRPSATAASAKSRSGPSGPARIRGRRPRISARRPA